MGGDAEMPMERSPEGKTDSERQMCSVCPDNEVLHLEDHRGSTELQTTKALELVNQAVQVFRCIEEDAAKTKAHAHDLARRASEKLYAAENQIRALLMKQSEAEANLKAAHARADEAEQKVRAGESQIAALESRVIATEHRAKLAEERATDTEQVLAQIEDTIRTQLHSRDYPTMGRSAAA